MNSRFDPDQAAYYQAGSERGAGFNRESEPSFFFYDLETSGINPREDRIMQFAGQRTNFDLEPVGEPVNLLVRLDDDTLPSPDAIVSVVSINLVVGIRLIVTNF
jgi:exodeoxyribonuclease I